MHDFFDALKAGSLSAVSYLKSAAYRDGHAGYSDPLDEQKFLVHVINTLEKSPEWTNTVVIVTYDDSDGWYDHVSNVINGSETAKDGFSGPGKCATEQPRFLALTPTPCMRKADAVMVHACRSW